MIIINTKIDASLVDRLENYYEKAKEKAEINKSLFQSIKESIQAEKKEESALSSEKAEKTLEEFKKEIYDIINSVSITGLAGSQIVINISDDAFEKMMNDEEFMKVNLGALIRDLSWPPTPMYNPSYVIFEINAVDGYKGTSYGSNYKNIFESKSQNSFWKKRKKKMEEYMEEQQKLKNKNLEMKRLNALAAARRIAISKDILLYSGNNIYMPSLFSAADILDIL